MLDFLPLEFQLLNEQFPKAAPISDPDQGAIALKEFFSNII
jgi:hypothetical protein